MKTYDLLSRESARGDSFKHLAACYQQPTKELVNDIKELEHHLATVCLEAARHVQKMMDEFESTDSLEPLTVDYARLFVGPYNLYAPPYGSVYLDGERQIMGDSTLDVRNKYRGEGVDVSADFRDPPDHIAAELEFMYFLVFKEIQALENSEVDTVIDYLEKQRAFLNEHLGAWVFDFADSIEEKAETNFYKNMARATKAYMKQELDYLEEFNLAQAS